MSFKLGDKVTFTITEAYTDMHGETVGEWTNSYIGTIKSIVTEESERGITVMYKILSKFVDKHRGTYEQVKHVWATDASLKHTAAGGRRKNTRKNRN